MARRRLKKKYRRALWIILALIIAIIAVPKIYRACRKVAAPEKEVVVVPSQYVPTIRNLKKQFNDLNPVHLTAAKKYGLKKVPENRDEVVADKLEEVSDCKYYIVDELTHSVPYLTKSGKLLLDEIGKNFADSLEAKGILPCRFKVTSILRTQEDVKRLRKSGNVNASANSAHCHGTTIDIAWASWDTPTKHNASWDQLRGVMAEVLRDLQKDDRCYVKYEAKESCFHITSRIDPKHPKK